MVHAAMLFIAALLAAGAVHAQAPSEVLAAVYILGAIPE
jgi:hypothetical protein